MHNSDSHEKTPPGIPWKKVLLWGLFIVLGIGVFILLIKALRRGGAGVALAAAVPTAARIIRKPEAQVQKPIDKAFILTGLRHIAEKRPLVTPTELFIIMQKAGVPVSSSTHMAQVLASMGLRSEVRVVSGRSERRWYDLTQFKGQNG